MARKGEITDWRMWAWYPSSLTPTPIDLAKVKCAQYFRALNADERYWR